MKDLIDWVLVYLISACIFLCESFWFDFASLLSSRRWGSWHLNHPGNRLGFLPDIENEAFVLIWASLKSTITIAGKRKGEYEDIQVRSFQQSSLACTPCLLVVVPLIVLADDDVVVRGHLRHDHQVGVAVADLQGRRPHGLRGRRVRGRQRVVLVEVIAVLQLLFVLQSLGSRFDQLLLQGFAELKQLSESICSKIDCLGKEGSKWRENKHHSRHQTRSSVSTWYTHEREVKIGFFVGNYLFTLKQIFLEFNRVLWQHKLEKIRIIYVKRNAPKFRRRLLTLVFVSPSDSLFWLPTEFLLLFPFGGRDENAMEKLAGKQEEKRQKYFLGSKIWFTSPSRSCFARPSSSRPFGGGISTVRPRAPTASRAARGGHCCETSAPCSRPLSSPRLTSSLPLPVT